MDFEPKWIAWEITRRCNLKCVHCRSSSELEVAGHPDFSFDEAKAIMDDIATYASPVLVLSGGEPLLRAGCLRYCQVRHRQRISHVSGHQRHPGDR